MTSDHVFTTDFCALCGFPIEAWRKHLCPVEIQYGSDQLLASLKEMGDWIAGGLQASDEAWPDARCLQHTEEIAARARAAVDKAEGRS